MKYIDLLTEGGVLTGEISFYCRMLHISRQGFYKYLGCKGRPWKYEPLANAMMDILTEDECNDTYGRERMYDALIQARPEGVKIPSERTVYRIMGILGISHTPKRKPNGITKADREAQKSGDLLKRDFTADKPSIKCVTDITEIKCADAKLYVSGIFDCYDLTVLGLAMDIKMKADLCVRTLKYACLNHPDLRGAICHSDRGSQYTSNEYREAIKKYGIQQSMNSAGGRCHDNARCESMWARMKEELLYGRHDTEKMPVHEVKALVWRYYMSYWNNRRICTSIGGVTPMMKRQQYYASIEAVA